MWIISNLFVGYLAVYFVFFMNIYYGFFFNKILNGVEFNKLKKIYYMCYFIVEGFIILSSCEF